jgi:hypothetical protein
MVRMHEAEAHIEMVPRDRDLKKQTEREKKQEQLKCQCSLPC